MAALESAARALQAENAALRKEHGSATQAHDTLLAHHREVSRETADRLEAVASLPLHRIRQVRKALARLAELLRSEAR